MSVSSTIYFFIFPGKRFQGAHLSKLIRYTQVCPCADVKRVRELTSTFLLSLLPLVNSENLRACKKSTKGPFTLVYPSNTWHSSPHSSKLFNSYILSSHFHSLPLTRQPLTSRFLPLLSPFLISSVSFTMHLQPLLVALALPDDCRAHSTGAPLLQQSSSCVPLCCIWIYPTASVSLLFLLPKTSYFKTRVTCQRRE